MDAAQTFLRPYLKPVTENLPAPVHNALISLLGPACHKNLILDVTLTHTECLKLAISKGLGIGIIGASSIVKVPQLIKLVNTQSARGVSFLSYGLETLAYVITLAYNIRHGFPFSTYGETALIAIQNIAIAVLILVYSGQGSSAVSFVVGLASLAYPLLAGGDAAHPTEGMIDMKTMGYLQMGAGGLSVASKIPQIYTIWKEGSTGELSAFAVFNYLLGSLARVYTTTQEVDDPLILYSYLAGLALNIVLAAQMLYYWNSPSPSKRSTRQLQSHEKAMLADSPASAAGKRSTPSTRRKL